VQEFTYKLHHHPFMALKNPSGPENIKLYSLQEVHQVNYAKSHRVL